MSNKMSLMKENQIKIMDYELIISIRKQLSQYRRAAEKAGFRFLSERILDVDFFYVYIQGSFKCTCDKTEYYTFCVELDDLKYFDPYKKLYELGSFSKQHLLDDGYSLEDATKISDVVENELSGVN